MQIGTATALRTLAFPGSSPGSRTNSINTLFGNRVDMISFKTFLESKLAKNKWQKLPRTTMKSIIVI